MSAFRRFGGFATNTTSPQPRIYRIDIAMIKCKEYSTTGGADKDLDEVGDHLTIKGITENLLDIMVDNIKRVII